ncbi:hypothetical protein M011DRAFT_471057 [Sporormia fimetaria CBS 119925]|uniref:Uncharacterized protein n=1 Tax=Sporormia fimetaria CBS 119925 TaxID=1340428 RepID=A0A6A6V076_9PLEO|nr:hypothetical protein M011DRAFT_471057 [Sporormia fimetaria CBS 119925]
MWEARTTTPATHHRRSPPTASPTCSQSSTSACAAGRQYEPADAVLPDCERTAERQKQGSRRVKLFAV